MSCWGQHSAARWTTRVVLAAALLCLPSYAAGPPATGRGNPSKVDITINGQVSSSIEISVTGSIDLRTNVVTSITGSGTAGVVDFGVYNLAGPLLTGEKHRVNNSPSGTYLVATLTAKVRFSGGFTSANVDLYRTNPVGGPPDVPLANMFYAFQGPRNNKTRNTRLIWPSWRNYPEVRFGTNVFQIPASTYVPGPGNVDSLMNNGDSLDHQIAVWIPDSQPPGPFSTVVTYTGTAR